MKNVNVEISEYFSFISEVPHRCINDDGMIHKLGVKSNVDHRIMSKTMGGTWRLVDDEIRRQFIDYGIRLKNDIIK